MGAIAKGVTSLFGGRARRREQKAAGKELGAAKKAYSDFEFTNAFEGLEAQQAQAQGYDVGQLGPAAQAQAAGPAATQGYDVAQLGPAQGYEAAQAQAAQAAKTQLGEDTGRTNQLSLIHISEPTRPY